MPATPGCQRGVRCSCRAGSARAKPPPQGTRCPAASPQLTQTFTPRLEKWLSTSFALSSSDLSVAQTPHPFTPQDAL